MKPKLLLRLAALLAMLTAGFTANAQIWLGSQLGNPAHQGSVVTNAGSLVIEAGGNDIWNTSDNGFYYFTWAQGNWDVKVRAQSLNNSSAYGGGTWSKVEMMVRNSDPVLGVQGGDAFIASMAAPQQGNGNQHQYRPARNAGAANGVTPSANTPVTFPDNWLRLTRTNNIFTMYSSPDNATWTVLATIDVSSSAFGFGTAWPDRVSVGVAVTAHDDGNSTANFTTATVDPPIISSSGAPWAPPSAAGKLTDVVNSSTYVGSEASFKFFATNNANPSLPMQYQWYKNGVSVPGITGTGYTWLAAAGDAGTQVYCVSTVQGYPSVNVTSSVGTVSVSTSTVLFTNVLKNEVFDNAGRNDVEIGNVSSGDGGNFATAGKIRWLTAFEDGGGYGDNRSRRVTGYFIPWATGNYTFYVAADDDTDVFVSTDATPAAKALVCQEQGWSGFNNWTTNADASPGNWNAGQSIQKSSDTWTNNLEVSPWASGFGPLTAGNRYYIEMDLHNGTGGDNGSVTAKLFTDPAPTNGAPSTLTSASNNIVAISWQPTTISFTSGAGALQPVNTTVSEGQGVVFTGRAATDSEFQPHYQWQRYGTNLPNATRSSFSISPTLASMNGAPFRLIANVPGLSSVTSSVATLTIQTAVFEPGFVLEQKWNGPQNIDGAANGTLGPPSYVAAIPALEASINNETGSSYTRQVSGFLIPATTGLYDFYTCSDDPSALFISNNDDPAGKHEIARENAWANTFEWTIDAGSGNIFLKSSVTWTNAGTANVAPYAGGILLTAGTRYYIEVNHSEGGGGDNVETAMMPHGVTPVNGTDYAPKGNLIGINAPKANYVAFTIQPTNPPAIGAGSGSQANFYAFGITDSTIAVGDVRANGPGNTEVANQFVFFQWYRNGVAINGATASRYTLTGLRPTDNSAQFMCQMRALGYGTAPNTRFWSNSLTATLTVTNDATVPTVLYSGYYVGTEAFSPLNWISLTFSVPMDPFTLTNPANYSVSGGSVVQSVVVSPDGRRVQLAVDVLPSGTPTVTITGARTWSSVLLTANTVSSHALPGGLTFKDIGRDNPTSGALDPQAGSRLYVEGTNSYTVAALGSDIWDTHDGFNFLYEQKTGDFDVVVRQTAYTLCDRWAKAGLMIREDIDPRDAPLPAQSRNWNIVNDPPALPCVRDGNGANSVEANWRTNNTSQSGTAGWQVLGGFVPTYPNAWVRVKRVGQVLTGYGGSDGASWTMLGQIDCTARPDTGPLPSSLFVGICVTGHLPDTFAPQDAYWNYATLDNYISNYVAPPPRPTITVAHVGGNVQISWAPTGGTLYSSTDLVNWTLVGAANPVSIPANPPNTFYRVQIPFP